jgi:2-keto-4-pentenoate hydratase
VQVRRLTDDQIQSAADMLIGLREKQLFLGALPADLTPENTADIQRIIDAVSAQIERPIRGWKSYNVYKPLNPPIHAPIYDLFTTGSAIPAELSSMRLIEPEIMFRADRDLPARERRYGVHEIMESVTAVVGFEVIGWRFRNHPTDPAANPPGSLYGSLSDHLANGCIVVGDAIPSWRDVAFDEVRLRMTEGDRELASVVGCHPFDDPFLPVVVGVNRLRRRLGVKAGEVIVTNSSTSFFPVSAGTLVRAVYEGLGEVTARFVAVNSAAAP